MTPGFTTHESSRGRKQKRTLNTPVSPWGISDTYSELQMSTILMNTPKVKFLGAQFLRTALKSQHSLVGVLVNFKFTSPGWLKSLLVQGSEDLSPVCFGVQPLPSRWLFRAVLRNLIPRNQVLVVFIRLALICSPI